MDLLHNYTEYTEMVPITCKILKQICSGKASNKIDLNLLFDLGGLQMLMSAGRNLKLIICDKSLVQRIYKA